ncbi:hypothetical protein [Maribacter sp. LLG6340-A2]|uniref:hypothetical protein n=1 Tax=Maribacter sp. LLG6340-A2 TaxID=3160834 RepID=UPI00386AE74A
MKQDLRKMFKDYTEEERYTMKTGHESRFLKKLESKMPTEQKSTKTWLFVAATIVVLLSIGLGYTFKNSGLSQPAVVTTDTNTNGKQPDQDFTFGDLSPDLKKVESYYLANINIELSKLEISKDNEELIDSYMEQLNNLNNEYKNLNTELKELGPNDQTISALIENLQLRLQLLKKLKKKLNQLKQSKNEQIM